MQAAYTARRRAGFTLIETIVTVGLLAVIASFVIPTVIQKAGAGDPVKVQNDLNTIQTALSTFATDSKAGFPHQISSLTSKPVANTSRLIDSTAMTVNQVTAWNGPYLGATISTTAGDSLATGFTAYVMNFLDRYDLVNNVPEHNSSGALNGTFSATSTLFAGIQIHGLTPAQAKVLNTIIDGGSDPNQLDGSNTTGRFRFSAPVGGLVVAFYLSVPITQ
jgi:prepilin-type N-terminal cleavage/methylation domain-containing protein